MKISHKSNLKGILNSFHLHILGNILTLAPHSSTILFPKELQKASEYHQIQCQRVPANMSYLLQANSPSGSPGRAGCPGRFRRVISFDHRLKMALLSLCWHFHTSGLCLSVPTVSLRSGHLLQAPPRSPRQPLRNHFPALPSSTCPLG